MEILEELNELLGRLRSTSSSKDKIEILRSVVPGSWVYLLIRYALDDNNFYITSDNLRKNSDLVGVWSDGALELLSALSRREIIGHDAIKACNGFLSGLSVGARAGFMCVLDKDLACGVNAKVANKAIPGWVPTFNVALADKWSGEKFDSNWVISRKIDGCFYYSTPILLADGSTMKIGEIVENKLPVTVLSYNEEKGIVEPKRVVNWFNNGIKKQWVKIKNTGDKINTRILPHKVPVLATPNHKFYVGEGYKPIADTNIAYSCVVGVNSTQEQILLGSLLGDGNISLEKRCKTRVQARISFGNSIKQKDYFDKKYTCLKPIVGKIREYTSGYGSHMLHTHTRTLPCINNLWGKDIKYILSKLGLLGIAIWYMDDGNRSKDQSELKTTNKFSRVNLGTYAFSLEDNEYMRDWLNARGYECKVREDKRDKGYYITLLSEGSQKFFTDIAPYIPESMEYKLPGYLRGGTKVRWWEDNALSYGLIKDSVEKQEVKYYNKKSIAYDIEVEDNHNYFAGGYLVHNCRLITVISSADDIKFYSRQGKEFDTLSVLRDELKELVLAGVLPTGIVLDGELCLMRDGVEDFQSIMKEVRRKDWTIENPMYKLFDVLSIEEFYGLNKSKGYKERIKKVSSIGTHKHISVVEHCEYSEDTFSKWQERVVNEGWEGLIVRKNVPYEGKRSKNMCKIKKWQSAEFKVIKVSNGPISVIENGVTKQKELMSNITIQLNDKTYCNVGSGFTLEDRELFYKHPELILGHQVEIKYFAKTTNQDGETSLRFPIFKCIRDEII